MWTTQLQQIHSEVQSLLVSAIILLSNYTDEYQLLINTKAKKKKNPDKDNN